MPEAVAKDQRKQQIRSLGIIFDIDGTLVAEHKYDYMGSRIHLRPYTIEFLEWCKRRGHCLALWTAGSEQWAYQVAKHICERAAEMDTNRQSKHICKGRQCRELFDFVWDGSKMRATKADVAGKTFEECRWCEFYSRSCGQCCCRYADIFYCPCRYTKDLRKVWYSSAPETRHFRQDTTLLVENTPQNCRFNYGNAIYVPTYHGQLTGRETKMFEALQKYVEEVLEPSDAGSVRSIRKCSHTHPGTRRPHACFEQDWWPKHIT